jgi:hypothetical protein
MESPGRPGNCPACGATAAAGSRFCAKCGAALAPSGGAALAPPAPGPGAAPAPPPVDIRTRVDDDRGVLKRIQLLIPGFRAYRLGEDIRSADSFLRLQVADKVHQAVGVVTDTRSSLAQSGQFSVMTDLAQVLADLQELEGEIRHAEQGYTGLAPAVRITPQQLDSLYQYDYGFVQAADTLAQSVGPLRGMVGGADPAGAAQAVQTVRAQVAQLDAAFKARLRAVEGILVAT